MGAVAAHCPSRELRTSFADMLVIYALETKWPMLNRVRAVEGLMQLGRTLDRSAYVHALAPLADPEHDLSQDVRPRTLDSAWVRTGELEATAIAVAASLAAPEPLPAWLLAAVEHARLDERGMMRAAAWSAIASAPDLAITGADLAMIDPESTVRWEALRCWRERVGVPPPLGALNRLTRDPHASIRVQLVELLAATSGGSSEPHFETLLIDDDAYVRRLAARRFVNG